MNWLTSIASSVIAPVAGIFNKREERKQTKVLAEAKLSQAKLEGKTSVTLTDAEWESISVSKQNESWKDEYVTLVITSPIVLLLVGSIWLAFTGDARLLDGVTKGIEELKTIGVNMGLLMEAVVFAAIGLKLWRST